MRLDRAIASQAKRGRSRRNIRRSFFAEVDGRSVIAFQSPMNVSDNLADLFLQKSRKADPGHRTGPRRAI
jgi:hypothetical protein